MLSIITLFPHGLACDTVVKTDKNYEAIQKVSAGRHVTSYDCKTGNSCIKLITNIAYITSSTYYQVRCGNTDLIVHPKQLFWLISKNDWIEASKLVVGDEILTLTSTITIDEISQHINTKPLIFYRLSIDSTQIFCITEHEIVAHNFSPDLICGSVAAIGSGGAVATFAAGTPFIIVAPVAVPIISAIAVAGGIGVLTWKFFKDRKERFLREQKLLLQEQSFQEKQKWLKEEISTPSILFTQQSSNKEKVLDKKITEDRRSNPQEPPKEPHNNKTQETLLPAKRTEQVKSVNSVQTVDLIRATINGVTKTGTAAEIYLWIREQQKVIFTNIRPILNNLIRNAKQIKAENIQMKDILHIFSEKHLSNGLMQLNENVEEVYAKVLQLIAQADANEMLIQGSNNIRTFINNIPIEVRI